MRIALDYQDKRLLRCWSNRSGEIAYASFHLSGLKAVFESPSDWHEHRRAWVRLSFGLFTLAFSFPWFGKVPKDDGQCSGPTYGFAFHNDLLWLYTGKSTSRDHAWITISMPWDWKHVRHSYLRQDGSLHHNAAPHEYDVPEDSKAVYPYTYARRNGEIQKRQATVNGEEREWRLTYCPWLPWPRKVSRSINVNFSDEVGERSGSWKGGTIGCGYEWKRGETQEEALRRMERERKF
jgi:hypothetical protein